MSSAISPVLQFCKHHYKNTLYPLLFQHQCTLCLSAATFESPLCLQCIQDLHAIMRITTGSIPLSSLRGLKEKPPFDRLICGFHYRYPLDQLIIKIKFHHQLILAKALGQIFADYLSSAYESQEQPLAIIPVPLHSSRLRERGFNQAIELGRPISKALGCPLLTEGITRQKATATQSSLQFTGRAKNIADAFKLSPAAQARLPKHVAVLDDVITTGHTIKEFCQILKNHGVEKIDVWCLARTLSKGLSRGY